MASSKVEELKEKTDYSKVHESSPMVQKENVTYGVSSGSDDSPRVTF